MEVVRNKLTPEIPGHVGPSAYSKIYRTGEEHEEISDRHKTLRQLRN